MCVSPTATELGAGNGLDGPARHHFLPLQLAKALAPAAAPSETPRNEGADGCLQSLAGQICGTNQDESAACE